MRNRLEALDLTRGLLMIIMVRFPAICLAPCKPLHIRADPRDANLATHLLVLIASPFTRMPELGPCQGLFGRRLFAKAAGFRGMVGCIYDVRCQPAAFLVARRFAYLCTGLFLHDGNRHGILLAVAARQRLVERTTRVAPCRAWVFAAARRPPRKSVWLRALLGHHAGASKCNAQRQSAAQRHDVAWHVFWVLSSDDCARNGHDGDWLPHAAALLVARYLRLGLVRM